MMKNAPPPPCSAVDAQALQELRHSLREENDVAIERRVARPTMEASLVVSCVGLLKNV